MIDLYEDGTNGYRGLHQQRTTV